MNVKGCMLIGSEEIFGKQQGFSAVNPATGNVMEPVFGGGTGEDVDHACALAWEAFDSYRLTSLEERARFLEEIAREIALLGDELILRASQESGLPTVRLEGERARTIGQLYMFAELVREGSWLGIRVDSAIPGRQPLPRSDLRMQHIPLGPVAVFGASNFPLAFSVAGGDTASALAAGAPVIVKGHSAHPGASELVGRAIQNAVKSCGLHEGVFALLFGVGNEIGTTLVSDHRVKAVGFTGSRAGGTALMNVAFHRPEPIPVYAEMSSSNPVFLMQGALKNRGEDIAKKFVSSLTMGAGQLCTNPGLVIAKVGPALDKFLEVVSKELGASEPQTMLTPGIYQAYAKASTKMKNDDSVVEISHGRVENGLNQCRARLYFTTALHFLADERLSEEIFGASSLVIACESEDEFKQIAENLEGQLTATLHMDESDADLVKRLLPILERKAGRILCNGFPTGVEVCHSMVHGGPYPSTSDSRSTSVGSASIQRFLRPVCYQDIPAWLMPEALRDDNPQRVTRLIDGRILK
ncbi:aldehyde dehydrogenase (NADP(+)) [Parasalinivibrio latis]|uniref:aldehyde dehydrogenase (NADP(+)) n=1 Tax=Parasalinivibrio latis TaxID=2952610 RepID=UPI0030E4798F